MKNNLKDIIKKKGLKIRFVIEKSKLSKTAFYDIMNGNAVPSLLNARRICNVLGCDLEKAFPNDNFVTEDDVQA